MEDTRTLRDFIIENLEEAGNDHSTFFNPSVVRSFLLSRLKGQKLKIPNIGVEGNDYGAYVIIDDNITLSRNNGHLCIFKGRGESTTRGNYLDLNHIEHPIIYPKDSIQDYEYRIEIVEKCIKEHLNDIESGKKQVAKLEEKLDNYKGTIELIKEKGKEAISKEDYIAYKSLVNQ